MNKPRAEQQAYFKLLTVYCHVHVSDPSSQRDAIDMT